ncbi:MAG: hypothetical protein JRN68_06400 [Nitrososphaerota archaeon]|nr:hypothetical protein [Ferrimicrobium acidiphilum]MDG6934312.1 hypothetical protein [Nitrososphaerota archaeon]
MSTAVGALLPRDDGWNADWEITQNALRLLHEFVKIEILISEKVKTTFSFDGQVAKLARTRPGAPLPPQTSLRRPRRRVSRLRKAHTEGAHRRAQAK